MTPAFIWFALQAAAADDAPKPQPLDVLFVGNSYTYGVPGMVQSIAAALDGPRVRATEHTHGGVTLRQHLSDGHLPALLGQTEPWEYVVLQEQSTLGVGYVDAATGELGSPAEFHRSTREIVSLATKVGAKPVVYATWAKKAFPAQAEPLRDAFDAIAQETHASVGPAGLAWEQVLRERPELDLYAKDGSHASPAGMYLNACVLYVTLTGHSAEGAPRSLSTKDPRGGPTVVSVPNDQADYLQRVAGEAVKAHLAHVGAAP